MNRRLSTLSQLVSFILLAFFLNTAIADQEHPAQKLVVETTKKMLAQIEKEETVVRSEPDRLYDLVEEMVLPHFDFRKMASWVLGKYWRKATPEQRKRFTQEFQTLLVRTYSNAVLEALGKEIIYLPLKSKKADATQVTVRTEVEQKGGFPIPLYYKMHLKDDQWKVYDVVIDNLSLVSNYRTSFAKEIKNSGIDQLIEDIAHRNADRAPS